MIIIESLQIARILSTFVSESNAKPEIKFNIPSPNIRLPSYKPYCFGIEYESFFNCNLKGYAIPNNGLTAPHIYYYVPGRPALLYQIGSRNTKLSGQSPGDTRQLLSDKISCPITFITKPPPGAM